MENGIEIEIVKSIDQLTDEAIDELSNGKEEGKE